MLCCYTGLFQDEKPFCFIIVIKAVIINCGILHRRPSRYGGGNLSSSSSRRHSTRPTTTTDDSVGDDSL